MPAAGLDHIQRLEALCNEERGGSTKTVRVSRLSEICGSLDSLAIIDVFILFGRRLTTSLDENEEPVSRPQSRQFITSLIPIQSTTTVQWPTESTLELCESESRF